VSRPPRPDDLYRLRIATEPRLSPDGRLAVVTLQTVSPGFDFADYEAGPREALCSGWPEFSNLIVELTRSSPRKFSI